MKRANLTSSPSSKLDFSCNFTISLLNLDIEAYSLFLLFSVVFGLLLLRVYPSTVAFLAFFPLPLATLMVSVGGGCWGWG